MSTFVRDTVERAVKTFAQALLALFTSDAALNVLNVPWESALIAAATAALISVLTSIVSRPVGRSGTASLVKEVDYDAV